MVVSLILDYIAILACTCQPCSRPCRLLLLHSFLPLARQARQATCVMIFTSLNFDFVFVHSFQKTQKSRRENKVKLWWIGLTQQGVQVQVTWFIMYPKLELLCNPSDLKLVAYYDNNALNHTKPLRYIGYFYQMKEFCAKADTNQSRSRVNSDQDSWKLQNSQLHLRSYLLSGRVSPHLTSVILRYSRIDTFQMTWQFSWQQKYGMKWTVISTKAVILWVSCKVWVK